MKTLYNKTFAFDLGYAASERPYFHNTELYETQLYNLALIQELSLNKGADYHSLASRYADSFYNVLFKVFQEYYAESDYTIKTSRSDDIMLNKYYGCFGETFVIDYCNSCKTCINFDVNYSKKKIVIYAINVEKELQGHGIANKLLNPLFEFYRDFGFQEISIFSTNNSFWEHIKETHPQINFNIKFAGR